MILMARGGGITLFRVRGIRVAVDYSWFLFLFLIIVWISAIYQDVLGPRESDTTIYALAVLTAFAFFGTILLHELGHAFAAIRRGISVSAVTLWVFGGVTRMDRDSDSPGTEFKVAIAGPLVTLTIAIVCIAAAALVVGRHDFIRVIRSRYVVDSSPLLAALTWLGGMNALIFVLNLIPAFPLDGGRIVRAIAWRITGDRGRGTRAAAGLGRGFSFAFIGLGLALLVSGDAIDGLWLMLIGWFLGQAARGAIVQSEVTRRLGGITVADLMDAEPVAIPENVTVEDAFDEYFLRYRWPWFFVVDAAHRFRGLVERTAADAVPVPDRASARVAEVVAERSDDLFRVPLDAPLESLLANEAMGRLGALAAVDAEGRLRGVITAEQVGRALRQAVGGPPAGTPPAV
jgi:Zn-dependent protease